MPDNQLRIIDSRELKHLVPFSRTHIGRLEKLGEFPARVHLGPNRVGWVQSEVEEWISDKMDKRGEKH